MKDATLNQCRRLKKLGYPQDTEFSFFSNHCLNGNNGEWDIRKEKTDFIKT